MRQGAAIGLTVLVLLVFPPSARSESNDLTNAILGSVGFAIAGILPCWMTELAAEDDGADDDAYDRRGWLVGAAGSYAIETFEDDEEALFQSVLGPTIALSVDNSFGFNGRAGYRCHSRFSAEVEVEWVNGFDGNVSLPVLGEIATTEIEPIVVTTNVKGYLLTGRYQPFLLLGGGAMTAEFTIQNQTGMGISGSERVSDFVMRFGGGIDVYATKNIVVSVGADYVLPFADLKDLDYVSIGWGIQYRF